jgi:hypothetical protein
MAALLATVDFLIFSPGNTVCRVVLNDGDSFVFSNFGFFARSGSMLRLAEFSCQL